MPSNATGEGAPSTERHAPEAVPVAPRYVAPDTGTFNDVASAIRQEARERRQQQKTNSRPQQPETTQHDAEATTPSRPLIIKSGDRSLLYIPDTEGVSAQEATSRPATALTPETTQTPETISTPSEDDTEPSQPVAESSSDLPISGQGAFAASLEADPLRGAASESSPGFKAKIAKSIIDKIKNKTSSNVSEKVKRYRKPLLVGSLALVSAGLIIPQTHIADGTISRVGISWNDETRTNLEEALTVGDCTDPMASATLSGKAEITNAIETKDGNIALLDKSVLPDPVDDKTATPKETATLGDSGTSGNDEESFSPPTTKSYELINDEKVPVHNLIYHDIEGAEMEILTCPTDEADNPISIRNVVEIDLSKVTTEAQLSLYDAEVSALRAKPLSTVTEDGEAVDFDNEDYDKEAVIARNEALATTETAAVSEAMASPALINEIGQNSDHQDEIQSALEDSIRQHVNEKVEDLYSDGESNLKRVSVKFKGKLSELEPLIANAGESDFLYEADDQAVEVTQFEINENPGGK